MKLGEVRLKKTCKPKHKNRILACGGGCGSPEAYMTPSCGSSGCGGTISGLTEAIKYVYEKKEKTKNVEWNSLIKLLESDIKELEDRAKSLRLIAKRLKAIK